MAAVLQPAYELSDNEYAALCQLLNHNETLTANSQTAINGRMII